MRLTGKSEFEWWSIYTANTLCLDEYRHGSVLFIGDSGHILPIFGELERVYDLLAQAIDAVGEQSEGLFLSKLCITLAHLNGDMAAVEKAIHTAGGETVA